MMDICHYSWTFHIQNKSSIYQKIKNRIDYNENNHYCQPCLLNMHDISCLLCDDNSSQGSRERRCSDTEMQHRKLLSAES